jgi:hypothetical protein
MFLTGIGIITHRTIMWNPFPVFRYRNNIQVSLNVYNNYNYVNYRRSKQAVVLLNLDVQMVMKDSILNNFSRRNANVSNRYELEQRRGNRNVGSRNEVGYSQKTETNLELQNHEEIQIKEIILKTEALLQERLLHKEQQIKETILKTEALSREAAHKQIKRANSQNRSTTSRETAQEKTTNQETILKTDQILQEKMPTKNRNAETIRNNTFRESVCSTKN